MTGGDRYGRMLRWYPAAWRERYGEELTALLEDTHGMARLPLGERVALIRGGTVERLREARVVGRASGPEVRLRGGALAVLWAWALFMVAGSVFAKFSEHWDSTYPVGPRRLPDVAYRAVQGAATAGGLLVLAAAVLVVPAFVRLVRGGRWREVRLSVVRAVVAVAVAVLSTTGLAEWARHLSFHDRNGALAPYSALFVVWGVVVVVALAASTAAAVAVARRLDLSPRTLRVLGGAALALTADMVVVIVGIGVWWGSVATVAPGVLGHSMLGTSNVVPPLLLAAGLLMLGGLALAGWGALRVGHSLLVGVAPRR